MNVVDSSAWLSYFAGDDNADIFAGPIENIERLLVPSITITEVFRCGFGGNCPGRTHRRHRVRYKLPLVDSIIYTTAQKFDAVIWTQDADFENLRNVEYFPKKFWYHLPRLEPAVHQDVTRTIRWLQTWLSKQ